jgi:hypothetical protein
MIGKVYSASLTSVVFIVNILVEVLRVFLNIADRSIKNLNPANKDSGPEV